MCTFAWWLGMERVGACGWRNEGQALKESQLDTLKLGKWALASGPDALWSRLTFEVKGKPWARGYGLVFDCFQLSPNSRCKHWISQQWISWRPLFLSDALSFKSGFPFSKRKHLLFSSMAALLCLCSIFPRSSGSASLSAYPGDSKNPKLTCLCLFLEWSENTSAWGQCWEFQVKV